ncbi:MAG TPA: hypothetical protein VL120_03385 [Solirubrobacteraceae bacterium]|nr:hypothetical protein [Solirubrobacteraceae bacterium]
MYDQLTHSRQRAASPPGRARPAPAPLAGSAPGPTHPRPAQDGSLPLTGAIARAVRRRATTATLQRYALVRAPEDNRLYSRSDDGKLVTGMETPNHELYIADGDQLQKMNAVIAQSPLEFYARGMKALLDRKYISVGLRFARARTRDVVGERSKPPPKGMWESFTRAVSSPDTVDLQALYEKLVLPGTDAYRVELLEAKLAARDAAHEGVRGLNDIAAILRGGVDAMNRFKKVVASLLANAGTWDAELEGIALTCRKLVAIAEDALYSQAQTADGLRAASAVMRAWLEGPYDAIASSQAAAGSGSTILFTEAVGLMNAVAALASALPAKAKPKGEEAQAEAEVAVDLRSFHAVAYQADVLAAIRSPDNVLLYRACDVTTSTLLGNQITSANSQAVKTYSANLKGRGEFHYATSVVSSGSDWVTLEGFAAGDLEREFSGVGEDSFRMLDNTWQYIMQGSATPASGALSPADQSFVLYTQVRYLLDGVYERGAGLFPDLIRKRAPLGDPGSKKVYESAIQRAGSSSFANVQAWRRAAQASDLPGDKRSLELMEQLRTRIEDPGSNPLLNSLRAWDDLVRELDPRT